MIADAARPQAAPVSVGAVRRSFAPWRDPAAEPLLRIEGVTRRFGDVTAVDALDLAIYEREFFCLLGPSGCGKTTLMRMIAGFETPSAGRIVLGGQDLVGVPPHRRPLNMMFQSYALFPHLSVEGNIAFGLKREGLPKAEIADRVAAILTLVQLEGLARRRPDQLSGGQRQRVALARALVKRPRLLLLDEPLGALDRKLREETQFELMDLQVELGLTFVVVTHDQDEAMTMADRIGVMEAGRLAQVGTPAEVYEAPASRSVAQFLGDVTLLEGVASAGPAGLATVRLTGLDTTWSVTAPAVAPGPCAIAIRPEKFVLHQDRPDPLPENCLAGEVWDIGYLGDWTTYRIRLVDGTILKVARANQARTVARPISWDDQVWVSVARDAAVLLAG